MITVEVSGVALAVIYTMPPLLAANPLLADFGMKMAARFVPSGIDDLDMNKIIVVMKNGGEEKLVDVEDQEKGEHVEIFIEQDSSKTTIADHKCQ